ncbi:PREDICTED: protein GLUTAMINE DUMPER 6 [Tarenaya hassleriana]|uniref:protein GLUTAMINE DUMPER 6 n=1 Tax=Tarenaya hassleriana TaxID=28532 RepID=UPI00053C41AB|nr:PREDICTED: protein GLUTAMINE DUMPER 6 [Tarenaya hassleriana]
MRPTPNQTAPRINIWNSPVPYLFGGLSVVLLLIALSLFLLVCSHRISSSSVDNGNTNQNNDGEDVQEREAKSGGGDGFLTAEVPKIVVILAGDAKPSCLAYPVMADSSSICRCNS